MHGNKIVYLEQEKVVFDKKIPQSSSVSLNNNEKSRPLHSSSAFSE